MATVNFILKNPKGKEPTPIILVFAFGKRHIKIQLGTKIHPKWWTRTTAPFRTCTLVAAGDYQLVKFTRNVPGVKLNAKKNTRPRLFFRTVFGIMVMEPANYNTVPFKKNPTAAP